MLSLFANCRKQMHNICIIYVYISQVVSPGSKFRKRVENIDRSDYTVLHFSVPNAFLP